MHRRDFIKSTTLSAAAMMTSNTWSTAAGQPAAAEVLNPQNRPVLSLIIDDSTALVNLAYYGIPQFAEVFPQNYLQDWRKLPREIPDSFVMEFMEWCDGHGVKGKYSMVPYPACTGWLHRFIPGWTKKELQDSIRLVRDNVMKNWDIHPEMISHTRVIDIRTGLPYPQATPDFMENWEWSQTKSADELGAYIAYALNVLKEAGLYCEGVTTPGGFAHRNIPNLAKGTLDAVREVYGTGLAHFFRDVVDAGDQSVAPQLFHVSGLDSPDPSCSVHIIGCTDDWFGGWDGLVPGDPDKFITADLSGGRLVEVIGRGEPAIMVCHWPGIYYNGEKVGFNVLKEVVKRLEQKYPEAYWMKNSEIARYWTARELTKIESTPEGLRLNAPFAAADFTIATDKVLRNPLLTHEGKKTPLLRADTMKGLKKNSYFKQGKKTWCCFDLAKGQSELTSSQ